MEIEPDEATQAKADEAEFQDEFKKLSEMDDEWREYFRQTQAARPFSSDDAAKREFLMNSLTRPESLQEHLLHQLHLSGLPEHEQKIGDMIVGSINDDGFLTTPPEELAEAGGYTAEEIEHVLATIREFDPIGVAARDLADCLLLQLARLGKADSLAATIVRSHLTELGGKKFDAIARALHVTTSLSHTASHTLDVGRP